MKINIRDGEKVKVFSKKKYLSVMDKIDPNSAELRREFEWSSQCDGKTKEECIALGYVVSPDWMEEVMQRRSDMRQLGDQWIETAYEL
jgi:hypothetical protein